MELEKKLNEYRARKRKGLLVKKVKSSFSDVFSLVTDKFSSKMNNQENVTLSDDNFDEDDLQPKVLGDSILTCDVASDCSETLDDNCFNWQKFCSYVLLWCSLFGLAVFAEFGAVFIILSSFVIIWSNTRTSPRRPGEVSAYSVFNPNCEAIDGTLDAKQFEKELYYGGIK